MSNMVVLGGRAFGRCLGHEAGALMSGILVLRKQTPQSSLDASSVWRHSEKMAIYEPGSATDISADARSAGTLS